MTHMINRNIGTLTVPNGSTESNAILAEHVLERMESIQIAAPASLGNATTAYVQSLDKIDGSAWGNKLSDGAPIALGAGERITITDIPLAGIRIRLDVNPGEDVSFEVVGKLSRQELGVEGI